MQLTIAGGSGFLGRALISRLTRDGHTVRILTRRPRPGRMEDASWTPDGSAGPWAGALEGVDAVINLSGENIGERRWNDARKAAIRTSRILSARSLVAAIGQAARPPAVFVSASAVGYYGPHGDELVTETTPPGTDFLATLCVEWEREAEQASAVTRVAIVRSGLVLDRKGGALAQMMPPFRFGVGGRLASGRQYMPWIHIDDWVGMTTWLIATADGRGAFNATAPNPVTNAAFAQALGRALHRPALVPVPAFGLRVLLGEFAESIVTGQRAIPARAEAGGYQFRFRDLDAALRDLLD